MGNGEMKGGRIRGMSFKTQVKDQNKNLYLKAKINHCLLSFFSFFGKEGYS